VATIYGIPDTENRLRKLPKEMQLIKGKLYRGEKGEQKVLQELSELDDNYYVLCGVKIDLNGPFHPSYKRSKIAQLDFVVVSKRGIVVIEVKNWSDEYLSKLKSYQRKYGGFPPHHQVDRAGKLLWIVLKDYCDLESPPVTRVLLSTYGNFQRDPKYEFVNVKNMENINSFIQTRNEKLSDEEVMRVVEYIKWYLPKKILQKN